MFPLNRIPARTRWNKEQTPPSSRTVPIDRGTEIYLQKSRTPWSGFHGPHVYACVCVCVSLSLSLSARVCVCVCVLRVYANRTFTFIIYKTILIRYGTLNYTMLDNVEACTPEESRCSSSFVLCHTAVQISCVHCFFLYPIIFPRYGTEY